MGNAEYMYAFQQVIMPIAWEFDPDLVIGRKQLNLFDQALANIAKCLLVSTPPRGTRSAVAS